MSRVLVTREAGFIGSHVAEAFARDGHEVVVYDNLSRARMLGSRLVIPSTTGSTWDPWGTSLG